MSTESPIVQEVRERAMKISARYGHDLQRYCRHLMELQQRPDLRKRLVSQITVMAAGRKSGARKKGKISA